MKSNEPIESGSVQNLILTPAHYQPSYLGKRFQRLASYRQQLLYATRKDHQSYLVVGKGDGFTVDVLKQMGKQVTVLDIDPTLGPDLVASVDEIPLDDDSVDASICCQVLEHLPFEKFTASLREMRRVSRRNLVLSVPDMRRILSMTFKLGQRDVGWQLSLGRFRPEPIPESRMRDHGHHWEIGFRGYPFSRVRSAVRDSGWKIDEVRRVSELPWHTFFYLAK